MTYLFLDIDGVLATNQTYNVWRRACWARVHPDMPYPRHDTQWRRDVLAQCPLDGTLLDRDCVRRLNQLTDALGAVIIVSSSWRLYMDWPVLRDMLVHAGVSAPLLGPTGDFGHRGLEIQDWLAGLPTDKVDTRVVILDDVEDVAPYNHRLIRTDSDRGLLDRHVRQALSRFG